MNGYGYGRRRGGTLFFLILYLVFGAYFINYALNFFPVPAAVNPFNKWIILAGGILIIIGAINHLRLSRYKRLGYY